MGLRETLNEKPALAIGIAAGVLLLGLVLVIYQVLPRGGGEASDVHYYTADGGSTWTPGPAEDFYTLGPEGSPRVRVRLYRWAPREEPFVGYLERATPDLIRQRQQAGQAGAAGGSGRPEVLELEVSRPGEVRWHRRTSREGQAIASPPRRPDGTVAQPVS
jgi:hypothetical protein